MEGGGDEAGFFFGVFTAKGINMEKQGVTPDVLVENRPEHLAKGEDAQVEKAVEVLREDVVAWKKNRENPARTDTGTDRSNAVVGCA